MNIYFDVLSVSNTIQLDNFCIYKKQLSYYFNFSFLARHITVDKKNV